MKIRNQFNTEITHKRLLSLRQHWDTKMEVPSKTRHTLLLNIWNHYKHLETEKNTQTKQDKQNPLTFFMLGSSNCVMAGWLTD